MQNMMVKSIHIMGSILSVNVVGEKRNYIQNDKTLGLLGYGLSTIHPHFNSPFRI